MRVFYLNKADKCDPDNKNRAFCVLVGRFFLMLIWPWPPAWIRPKVEFGALKPAPKINL